MSTTGALNGIKAIHAQWGFVILEPDHYHTTQFQPHFAKYVSVMQRVNPNDWTCRKIFDEHKDQVTTIIFDQHMRERQRRVQKLTHYFIRSK